ncbi:unnamed protein product [Coregonus sp. 'balchen']|nr:unnamed protein product [Coregonus sp. 'balchen']
MELRLSLCDLAGSERCGKTKTFGERLKEAGNINNSLLILGKCIAALRSNQSDGMKNGYIPFRESKLTRLFQSIFCGKGRASMIVNINQCASTYDETLHVMKFSAIAKQPLLKNGVIDDQALEHYLSEEELLDEDEADMSILPQEDLLNVIENLRTKLLAERRKNLVAELKESYQEKLENTFEMYKDALKDHAYQRALERVEDDYVPLDEFIAEQEKVEALEQKLSEMERKLSGSTVGSFMVPTKDNSSQTESISPPPPVAMEEGLTEVSAGDVITAVSKDAERCKLLLKEKSAVEKLCEQKQALIVSLEKRITVLNDALREAGDCFFEKTAEIETLHKKLADQAQDLESIGKGNLEKDKELAALKEELAKLSQKSPVQSKPKRGFMANIRQSVTSPRTSTIARTLRKSSLMTASSAKSRWPPMVCLRRMFFFLLRVSGEDWLFWAPTPNMSSADVRRRNLSLSVILRCKAGSGGRSDSLREEELRLPVDRPFFITSKTRDSRVDSDLPSTRSPLPVPPSIDDSLSVFCRRDRLLESVSHSISLWDGKRRRGSSLGVVLPSAAAGSGFSGPCPVWFCTKAGMVWTFPPPVANTGKSLSLSVSMGRPSLISSLRSSSASSPPRTSGLSALESAAVRKVMDEVVE